jgi:hypothetical protein
MSTFLNTPNTQNTGPSISIGYEFLDATQQGTFAEALIQKASNESLHITFAFNNNTGDESGVMTFSLPQDALAEITCTQLPLKKITARLKAIAADVLESVTPKHCLEYDDHNNIGITLSRPQ